MKIASLLVFFILTSLAWGHDEIPYFGASKVHRYKLPNGLKLIVYEDHSAPTFAYQTWFNVGSRDEVKGLTGLAHLFEHMMFKATQNRTDGEFDRILESAGAEGENAFTSRDYTGYVQSLPSGNLDLITSLEAERMVNLIVDDKVLNTEREVVQNERRFRNENNPDGQLNEKLYETAYTKHPYHWPIIGYEEDLKAVQKVQCEEFYKTHYVPNNATIVVVGDVKPDQVFSTVEKYYGKLKAGPVKTSKPIEPEPDATSERSETLHLKIAVDKLLIGYRIPNVNHVHIPSLHILANILAGGKSSRLYQRLVDGGIATEADVYIAEGKDPGLLVFGINMQKQKTAKQALGIIDSEIQKVLSGRIQPEEIERAMSQFKLGFFEEQLSNAAKARFFGYYETVSGDFERGIQLVHALKAVDKAHLLKVAKT